MATNKEILALLAKAKSCISSTPINWEKYNQFINQALKLIEAEDVQQISPPQNCGTS